MIVARETVYEALLAKVMPLLAPGAVAGSPDGEANSQGVTAAPGVPTAQQPFNLISREVIEVQRVPPELQPVLFMDEAMEEYRSSGVGLVRNVWTVYFHVGCTSPKGTAAATILNPLLDTLTSALAPTDGDLLGLGDFINEAQLVGLSVKNLGNNNLSPDVRQAVAYVPFQLILPS
jgi:hypothetical protein